MRYGVAVGGALPGGGSDPEDLVRLAEAAELLEFDSICTSDHLVHPTEIDHRPHQRDLGSDFAPSWSTNRFEMLTTCAFLAGKVKRVKLVLAVLVVPYRNPIISAKMLSMLDVLSSGRLVVGVGVGWMREEFELLDAPPYEERGSVTDEYVQLFIELWTSESPSFNGKYCHISGIGFLPKPVQKPHPPIWIGGNGLPALHRVVRYGQGWLPIFQSPHEMAAKIQQLRRLLIGSGRDPDEVAVSVGCPFKFAVDRAGRARPWLTGTNTQIVDDLRRYSEAGVNEVFLLPAVHEGHSSVRSVIDRWTRFAEEVRPRV
jgi:probable F420-dependent oxidoreductase